MSRLLVSVALISLIGFEHAAQAVGCLGCGSGCPPDHWFNATITIDPQTLPKGVSVETKIEYTGNTMAYFTNATDIPLIINPPDPTKTYFEPYPRPLTMKLVSNNTYYCDVLAKPMDCSMNARVNLANAVFDTPEINKTMLNAWITKDDRPADVQIPAPQKFQSPALYGEQTIMIGGEISYSLNEKYDPKAATRSGCAHL
jgi:hypothetical protein